MRPGQRAARGREPGPAPAPSAGETAPPPRLAAVCVVAGDGEPLLPCGRCRQLLLEAGGEDLLVQTAGGPVELAILLPAAFTGTDLAERRDQRPAQGSAGPGEPG